MQKVVLFLGPDKDYKTPSKIGNLYINRFAIDEDESNEILKIYQMESSFDLIYRASEGTDLIYMEGR